MMSITWQVLKDYAISKSVSIQYIDLGSAYQLFVVDGSFQVSSTLEKDGNAETLDFETNFKPSGNLTILQKTNPQNDYFTSIQRGLISGHTNVSFAGYNSGLGTSKEMVWVPSSAYTWKTSAAIVSLVSSNASDTLAGTGAKVILIQGLDSSYNEIQETVNLSGTTPVNTTQSYLRVNTLTTAAVGSVGTNVGNITATHTATTINYIAAGEGLSQSAFYTLPSACKGYIYSGYLRCSRNDISGDFYVRSNGVVYKVLKFDIAASDYSLNIKTPYQIPAQADIWIEAAGSGGLGGSTAVSAFVEMIKIQDGT